MSELTDDAVACMEKSPFALLITVDEEKRPAARYIGPFVNDGLAVYFVTRTDSRKVNHMNGDPYVALVFQNPEQSESTFKSVVLSGEAASVDEGVEFNTILEMLGQKSPGFRKYIDKDGFRGWSMFKIHPRSVQCTDLSKSLKTTYEEV